MDYGKWSLKLEKIDQSLKKKKKKNKQIEFNKSLIEINNKCEKKNVNFMDFCWIYIIDISNPIFMLRILLYFIIAIFILVFFN